MFAIFFLELFLVGLEPQDLSSGGRHKSSSPIVKLWLEEEEEEEWRGRGGGRNSECVKRKKRNKLNKE